MTRIGNWLDEALRNADLSHHIAKGVWQRLSPMLVAVRANKVDVDWIVAKMKQGDRILNKLEKVRGTNE